MNRLQRPTTLHTWVRLSQAEREEWLEQSRDRYFAGHIRCRKPSLGVSLKSTDGQSPM